MNFLFYFFYILGYLAYTNTSKKRMYCLIRFGATFKKHRLIFSYPDRHVWGLEKENKNNSLTSPVSLMYLKIPSSSPWANIRIKVTKKTLKETSMNVVLESLFLILNIKFLLSFILYFQNVWNYFDWQTWVL